MYKLHLELQKFITPNSQIHDKMKLKKYQFLNSKKIQK